MLELVELLDCIHRVLIFFWLLFYCFWAIHDKGRYFEILCYLCFLFHCLLIYIYKLFMIYVFILCFVK